MNSLTLQDEFLRVKDVCELLGLNRRTVYGIIAREELPATKIGGQYFLRRSDLDSLMAGRP